MNINNPLAQQNNVQAAIFSVALVILCTTVQAQPKSSQDAINEYRQSLADGNPADLNAARGEVLWRTKVGPKQVSLEACDLGLGAGKVMDMESRLVHCMVTLQGAKREDFTSRTAFSGEGAKATLIEDLVAYVYDESRDMAINVPLSHAAEKAAYARGKQAFYFKAGPYDFSCASCHSQDGKRIRLQDLPNLTQAGPAQAAFSQ